MQAAFQDATTCKRKFITMNPAARLDFDRDGIEKEKAIWTGTAASFAGKRSHQTEHSEYFPLFLLMVFGALGPAEAFNLQWKDVTLGKDKGSVTIVRKLKNRFRRRNAALRGDLLASLKARHKKLKPAASDYVFTGPTGGPIQDDNFRKRVWQPLVKLAKVPMITPCYGLRRHFSIPSSLPWACRSSLLQKHSGTRTSKPRRPPTRTFTMSQSRR